MSSAVLRDSFGHWFLDPGNRPNGIVGLATVLLLSLLALYVADRLYHPEKFQFQEIEVKGALHHVDKHQIEAIVEKYLDGNYFSVSLHRLEQQIKTLPWVFSASLRRQWPSTLIVEVTEIQPVALWGHEKWLHYSGELVDRQRQNTRLPLPKLDGRPTRKREIWQRFEKWSKLFASNGLSLDALRLDDRELWYLDLSRGVLAMDDGQHEQNKSHFVSVIVEGQDAEDRIKRFIEALNLGLDAQFFAMKTVDLRYPNGFAIDWYSSDRSEEKNLGAQ